MDYKIIRRPTIQEVEVLQKKASNVHIGFIGDICLDIYWRADMRRSELSRETPHHPLPIHSESLSLGAGGNVLANLAALQPAQITAIGVLGEDWRGMLLRQALQDIGISLEHIVLQKGSFSYAYAKPVRYGFSDIAYEDPRLDFLGSPLSKQTEEELLHHLQRIAQTVELLCVSDQFASGCITPVIRNHICRLAKQGLPVVVDSRDHAHCFKFVTLKPNELEGERALEQVAKFCVRDNTSWLDEKIKLAQMLSEATDCNVCLTLGEHGSIQVDGSDLTYNPAGKVEGPVDFCGAGDSFLSAYSLALATGESHGKAASVAALASEVTIQKLGTTGTASWKEIQQRIGEWEENSS